MPNFRDLGGYTNSDGDAVRFGLVYRSSQLSRIGAADMEAIAALKLKSDYDLRTADEREKRPDELPQGINNVWLDVLADLPQAGPAQLEMLLRDAKQANEALGGGKMEAMFAKSYRDFVSLPSAKRGFGRLFAALGDRNQLPAVFHCTTGKDRAGWAAAALLTLLGVPKDQVYDDYLRSNDYILPTYKNVIDSFVAAGGEAAIPLAIFGVRREYLDAAFDELDKEFGTIENYFSKGLGIDAAQQQAIQGYLSQSRLSHSW